MDVAVPAQYDPAGQARQSDDALAPTAPLYVPAAQGVAAETPSPHHDPGGHVKHAVSAYALVEGL